MDTKKLRQKILDLAIRGKLVPQDPNDEPASVLLERIRAEKERLIKEGKIKRSKKSSSDTPHYENEAFKVPFEIPDGWISCRFDRICSKFSTGPFGSMVHKADYVSDGGVPIVNPMNIVAGDILNDNLMMVSNEKAQELNRYRLSVDDILIARRGDLKKCAIVKETTVDWLCGTGSFFLHVPYVESRYIQLFYLSEYVQTILSKECVGATMDNLNQSVLGAIPFLLPPQKEQRRIISEVDKWFSLIDTLKTEKEDLQTYIAQAKSKILYMAIHGKLVPQDPNDELAIELLKRINPRFTPCDNAHYENVPEGWTVCTLEEIIDYEQPQAYIVQSTDYKSQYKIPVLTAGKSFIIGYTNESEGIFTDLPVIIFDDFTTDSKFVDFPFKVKSSAMKILHVKEEVNIQYICWFMSVTRLIGDTHKRYWISEYSKLHIPIPPRKEQDKIINKVNELFQILDNISGEL